MSKRGGGTHLNAIDNGFTLAEVLITLAIIGIVAALTMPNLIANHQKKVLSVQAKRFYSLLNQAYLSAIFHNGDSYHWSLGSGEGKTIFEKYIFPELSGVSYKNDTTFYKNYDKYVTENNLITNSYSISRNGCFSLTSGEIVMPNSTTSGSGGLVGYYYITSVRVDVNGFKKPNIAGKDIHTFFIVMRPATSGINLGALGGQIRDFYVTGIIPSGYNLSSWCRSYADGTIDHCCTAKLMEDGWEFKDDYPW